SFICAALKRGIRIPGDLSILSCYPATWEAVNSYPVLTAVEHDLEEMVHVAFSMLRDLMDGKRVREKQVFSSPRLIKRDTVLRLKEIHSKSRD
ncbi:MAG: substrate-binding domain-containing protein, partial [Victivallales bacterium]